MKTKFISLFSFIVILLMLVAQSEAITSITNTYYLPIIFHNPGRPDFPTPVKDGEISVPGLLCPNELAFSDYNNSWYVTSFENGNVSIIRNRNVVKTVHLGGHVNNVAPKQNSPFVYISNFQDDPTFSDNSIRACGNPTAYGRDPSCISVFNGDNLVKQYGTHYEAKMTSIHPTTGTAYTSDLDSHIILIDDLQSQQNVRVQTTQAGQGGWMLNMAHDPVTGLTYLPSRSTGHLFVINGSSIQTSFPFKGHGADDIELLEASNTLYITHSREFTNSNSPTNNISIIDTQDQSVRQVYSASKSKFVADDEETGYVYITNPSSKSVSVFRYRTHVATVSVPGTPFDVEVNEGNGYAFITLPDDDKVVVMKGATIKAVYDLERPFHVGVDETSGETYVVTRPFRWVYNNLNVRIQECLPTAKVAIYK